MLVKGGYTPDVLIVQHGKPVRFNFRREETAACSEMVVFNDFGKSAQLPTGETVPVEFLPEKPGEYEFSCQMGMFRGQADCRMSYSFPFGQNPRLGFSGQTGTLSGEKRPLEVIFPVVCAAFHIIALFCSCGETRVPVKQ